ncbi:MAG: hypothetical protein DMF85_02350 [Acidobacteria bacterium]|nr:MAG: hypothetical protein DMF85_02350 [Acidobacteriota bacterium]
MSADLLPELALIPAGEFVMGSDDADEDERPAHRVHVDDFFIGVQPVMNREYARFVRDAGHRAPAIYELPLVVTAGGADRERLFRQTGTPYVWSDFDPPDDRSDHPVTLVRFDDALAYCAWLCRPSRSGRRRRAAASTGGGTRGATASTRTWPTSSSTPRSSRRTARRRAARIRRTGSASTIWRATSGNGCRIGTTAATTSTRLRGIRRARRRVRSASSAAAGGSSPTCVCSRAATGTRSRPTRTPTRSGSASCVRWCDVRGRQTGVLTDAWLDSRPFRLKAEATIFYVG